ncbi:hypothetical protein PV327_007934 [Microctonus hyperodae]|uniref:G-protein coupled receptors family 1 profile domain-containing protein n=1 Tax=Microctonus hyperodae TaxID=165561 RepID=A0AA39KZ84_MICHY|nr:hypothetical protein PV327_007934 [Microctonus hyperodae]
MDEYTNEIDSSENTSGVIKKNCTNDYCITDEEYIDLIADFLKPDFYDWLLITMHIIVFIIGIIGNSLVCVAIYRNRSMRTVTNYFIVNLAIADLMVIIFCLPSTVLWDITETWFLGDKLCKIIPYLQTVSVSVSIFTLTAISIDRWYAICFPLEFKSTTKRAKKIIFSIWIVSFLFDIPDAIVLHIVPQSHLKVETVFFTQCAPSWSINNERIFTIIKLICLYFGPLIFMVYAYSKIFRVLWKSEIPGYNLGQNVQPITELTSSTNENLQSQLITRRNAAKMLVAVVLIFGLCYAPVHLLTILRQSVGLESNDFTIACSLIAHWLCYANSAVNPIIYNFMSGKFRKEFKRSFYCSSNKLNSRGSKKNISQQQERFQTHFKAGQSSSNINNKQLQNSELIPLNTVLSIDNRA